MIHFYILNYFITCNIDNFLNIFINASKEYRENKIWLRGLSPLSSSPKFDTRTIFDKNDYRDNISCFRIPSIISTNSSLISFSEARLFNCSDDAEKGIVIKTSYNNGITWNRFSWLVKWGNRSGNPTSLYDSINNRVILHYSSGGYFYNNKWNSIPSQNLNQLTSTDNGITWEKKNLNKYLGNSIGIIPGPGNGIQMGNRYLFNGHFLTSERFNGAVITYYSDDFGETFQISRNNLTQMDESTFIPINKSTVVLNMRNKRHYRGISFSYDKGNNWNSINYDFNLLDSNCEASSSNINGNLLFLNPNMKYSRSNLTLYHKKQVDNHWKQIKVTDPFLFSGYSGIVNSLIKINTTLYIGIIWESCYEPLPFRVWCTRDKEWNIKFSLIPYNLLID